MVTGPLVVLGEEFVLENTVVRELSSAQPFRQAAKQYLRSGWFPFPLKPKLKEPWASGVTGRKNKFPDDESLQVGEWLAEAPPRANIGLWVREDVIGIDVDHYEQKKGGDTLARLERQYGKLPPTWISSARSDGISGIRFFRIPKKWVGKLSWSGKAGDSIEIIQTGHRYAAVWPSWNPDANGGAGAGYQWYPAGQAPNGKPDRIFSATRVGQQVRFGDLKELPDVDELPLLPEPWVEYLTRGYVEKTDRAIDMESSGNEIEAWAKKNFGKAYRVEGEDGKIRYELCRELQKRLDNAVESVRDSDTSHDKLVAAHWSLLSCGKEGHRGVLRATQRFEKAWTEHSVKELENRSLRTAQTELFRSRIEALRKIKGDVDKAIEAGGDPFRTRCGCPDPTVTPPDIPQDVPEPLGTPEDPTTYEPTHDGTADYFTDLYVGDMHWVESEEAWFLWNGQTWEQDATGLVHRMFRVARSRMLQAGENLVNSAMSNLGNAKDQFDKGSPELDEVVNKAKKASKYLDWAKSCGNKANRDGSILHARSIAGVSVRKESFNQNRHLLGVANGVIELPLDGPARFRLGEREDMITLNTGTPYIPTADQIRAGGDLAKGVRMLDDYRETFVPDDKVWEFLQICIGSSLYGYNLETKIFFVRGKPRTGKSTIIAAVGAALGALAMPPGPGIFDYKELNPSLVTALPKRLLFDAELDERLNMDANQLKKLSGRDKLSVENKNSRVIIQDTPAFSIWISTNNVPRIQHLDEALRHRILAIPFSNQVLGMADKRAAMTELQDFARPAVLAWAIEGWAKYRELGSLDRSVWPKAVVEASSRFFDEMSPVGDWAHEAFIDAPGHHEDAQEMYLSYRRWALEYQKMPEKDVLTRRTWATAMKTIGRPIKPKTIDGESARYVVDSKYTGLKLKNVAEFNVQRS